MLQFVNEHGIINLFIIVINYLYTPDTEEPDDEPESEEEEPYCEQSTESLDVGEPKTDLRAIQEIELTQLH